MMVTVLTMLETSGMCLSFSALDGWWNGNVAILQAYEGRAPEICLGEGTEGKSNFEAFLSVSNCEGWIRIELCRMDGILGGVDACQGDSGGPLWVEWDGRATQVETFFRFLRFCV